MSCQSRRANREETVRPGGLRLTLVAALTVSVVVTVAAALAARAGTSLGGRRRAPSCPAGDRGQRATSRSAAVVLAVLTACILLLPTAVVAGPWGDSIGGTDPDEPSVLTARVGRATETPEPAFDGAAWESRESAILAVLAMVAGRWEDAQRLLDAAGLDGTTVALHHFDGQAVGSDSDPEATADALDSSLSLLNAHLYNGLGFVEEGRFGEALGFDGVDDYAELGGANSLAADGPYQRLEMRDAVTVEAWVNPTEGRPGRNVIMSNENAANYGLSLVSAGHGSPRLMFTAYATNDREFPLNYSVGPGPGGPAYGWYWAVSSVPVPPGRWTHVAGSFERGAGDGRYLKVFVNGVEVTDVFYSRQPPGDDYFIVPGSAVPRGDPPEFVWPLPGEVTNGFGLDHPLGIDVAARPLQPVVATAPGTVTYAGGDPCFSYGLYVVIAHGRDTMSVYAHLASLGVTTGEEVAQGAIIGFAGDSGYAEGTHLHFEIRRSGRPVNPLGLLSSGGEASYLGEASNGPGEGSQPSADELTRGQRFVLGARPGWWDGASWRGVGSLFEGRIDEVRVSKVALRGFDLTRPPGLRDDVGVPRAPLSARGTTFVSWGCPERTSARPETPSPTPSLTPSPADSPVPTASAAATATPARSATPPPSASPSLMPTIVEATPAQGPSPTSTATPSPTPIPTESPTPIPTSTPAPEPTPTWTPSPEATSAATPSPSSTPEPSPTPSPSSTPAP